jgi:gliding motility-associated-like protein
LGSTTVTWWVADTVRNVEKDVQNITVKDMEFPKGTCPEDIEIVVNDDVDSTIVDYNMSYADNCGMVKITRTSGKDSGSFFKVGETIVTHEIADTAGNVSVCRFKVLVRYPYRALEVALKFSANGICSGEPVTLTAVASGGSRKYTYTWTPRPWTGAVLEDYPLTNTRYEVTVNDGVTSQSKSVDIAVLETQPVTLEYDGRMDEIMEGEEVAVKATDGFASYKFLLNNEMMQEVGLNNQLAFMAELGTYIVRVFATDINYCVAQDQLEIDVESKKLPNVFTPDQDGKNEIFLEGYDLMVFSRAGELLYKGVDGWTGFYKGKPLPQGTYLYVVRRTMNNGEFRVYKGAVTLKR